MQKHFAEENGKVKKALIIGFDGARETFQNEDWLILITSDHGGHKTGHGTQKAEDRMTFIAGNQKISE